MQISIKSENAIKLLKIAQLTIEDQQALLKAAAEPIGNAHTQRAKYNKQRQLATKISPLISVTLGFDYAKQVFFPSSPQQVGISYFKANRKCGLFGIHDEGTGKQCNYLIDEGDSAGKGANSVISMLYHYLESVFAEELILFADNCVGQDKNNAVIHHSI